MIVILAAIVIGLSLGLFGSGGSILTVPVLLYLLTMPAQVAIASSLLIAGSYIGKAIGQHLPVRLMQKGFAIFLVGMAMLVIYQTAVTA